MIWVVFFRNSQLFKTLDFCRFFKTHNLTHTGKGLESTGQRFYVHSASRQQRGKGVAEIVKPNVFHTDDLQNFVIRPSEGVRVIHSPGLGRREQIRVARVLFLFGDQQVDCLLGNS